MFVIEYFIFIRLLAYLGMLLSVKDGQIELPHFNGNLFMTKNDGEHWVLTKIISVFFSNSEREGRSPVILLIDKQAILWWLDLSTGKMNSPSLNLLKEKCQSLTSKKGYSPNLLLSIQNFWHVSLLGTK